MNNKTRMSLTIIGCGLAIAVGPGMGGYFIGKAIERFKTHDRTVVVKGLSEREVKSDLAVWNLTVKASGNDLAALNHKMVTDKKAVIEFLKAQGFEEEEIKIGTLNVTDKFAREWGDQKDVHRYIVEDSVSIRSTRVDLIKQSTGKLSELIEKEIIISSDPKYYTPFRSFCSLRDAEVVSDGAH